MGAVMTLKRDKHDLIFSQLIRERSGWRCDCCHRLFVNDQASLHCSHINGRRHTGTRWHPMNALAHCIGCHRKLGSEPVQMTRHAEKLLGREVVEAVHAIAMRPSPVPKWQRDRLYDHFKEELKRLRQLRAEGVQGRIEFTAPDFYQRGISL